MIWLILAGSGGSAAFRVAEPPLILSFEALEPVMYLQTGMAQSRGMSDARARKPYPSDVSDEEWPLVVPYLTLMKEDAPQREYAMRELLNALRYVVRYGIAWRAMANDFSPGHAVRQQAHRWLVVGCFDAPAQDLRAVLLYSGG